MLTSRSLGKLQYMVHRTTYDLMARIYILLRTNAMRPCGYKESRAKMGSNGK